MTKSSGRVVALLLTRIAAGFGGFMAGTGLIHGIVAGNPWGFALMAFGLAMLVYGIRQAARLASDTDGERRV
jgi:hypothetical protein